jgi:hypothetical protein
MRSRHRGKYSVKHNNCHDFVNELLRQVSSLDNDQSSFITQWTGSTITLEVGSDLDEKLDSVEVSVDQNVPGSFTEKQHEIVMAAGRL